MLRTGTGAAGRRGQWRNAALLHGTLWALLALFFGTFFNRFAALRSGNGEFSGGMALLQGHLPYRDFFTAGPPLNSLKAALLLHAFGQRILVLRLAAVLERLLLASLLVRWFGQLSRARYAAVAAFVTVALSAGDRTDPLASYNHDALFWAILASLLASAALRPGLSWLRVAALGCLAGVSAALSFLTKQTVGGVILLTLLVLPAYLLGRAQFSRGALWSGSFLAGVAPPAGAVALLLEHLHILRPALQMLFVTGPSAKAGHPGDFVRRWFLVGADSAGWVVLGLFWCLLALFATRAARRQLRSSEDDPAPAQPTSLWLAAGSGVVLAVVLLAEATRSLPALHDSTKAVVYAVTFGLVGVLARALVASVADRSLRADRLLLCAVSSAAVAFALSLSWPAFEAMLLPGLGLLVALTLGACTAQIRRWIYGLLAFLLVMQLREKLDLPFGFDLQDEGSVASAQTQSRLDALRGLRLPAATVQLVDDTAALVAKNTCPGDGVFTFPEMGLLYTLTDRWPPTWSPSHNVDVVNDTLARADTARLLAQPPAVLITYPERAEDWTGTERLWRGGHRSGQREMAEAVTQLARAYQLKGSYTLRAGDPPIHVYLRPGAATAAQRCRAAGLHASGTIQPAPASDGLEAR